MISTLLLMLVAILLAVVLVYVRRSRHRQTSLEKENATMQLELARHREAAQSILRELGVVFGVLFVFTSCSREQPLSATCTPHVNVTVPVKSAKATKQPAPQREVVHVYWDVSSSMREFALRPVVDTLDSRVLLNAHAQVVEQYGVGESIRPLTSARDALQLGAKRTALHLAAERIGATLASGSAQAALLVSDMELDTPPRTSPTVCGGVPLPTNNMAGALFGRCFEKAVLAPGEAARSRTSLLIHVFRKSTKGRELFILLFATDREFGESISKEIGRHLDFPRQVIFDSGTVAAANVKACRMTVVQPYAYDRSGAGKCGAKCMETSVAIQTECDLRRIPKDAWIHAAGRAIDGASYSEQQAAVRFAIPCDSTPGRFNATVHFNWRESDHGTFGQSPNVRDLFDSLTDAIVRTVAPRRLHIGIDLQK